MPPPEAPLPETRARRCPACQSEQITALGHVTAAEGMIRVDHRCERCNTRFVFVRKAIL